MIKTVQIDGEPDTHPEHPIHDASDLASGKVDLFQLPVSKHHVEVFDMMDCDSRSRYESLYSELAAMVKAGKAFVLSNSRSVLSRPDGSTGWYKYVEWTEFDTSGILGA